MGTFSGFWPNDRASAITKLVLDKIEFKSTHCTHNRRSDPDLEDFESNLRAIIRLRLFFLRESGKNAALVCHLYPKA